MCVALCHQNHDPYGSIYNLPLSLNENALS